MTNDVFENGSILILGRFGLPGRTLVVFSAILIRDNERDRWRTGFFRKYPGNIVAIIPKSKNYFPKADMVLAAEQLKSRVSGPTVLYGSSMGGYAALKYSKLFDASIVIAFSPQYSISPQEAPYDKYRHSFYNAEIHSEMGVVESDLSGDIAIIYDPNERVDRLHARKLTTICVRHNKLLEITVPYAGHQLITIVSGPDALEKLSIFIKNGQTKLLSDFFRKEKKTSSAYYETLATALAKCGHANIASSLLETAKRYTQRPYHLDIIKARILNAKGDKIGAIKAGLEAYSFMPKPGNPEIPYFLGGLFQDVGDMQNAITYFKETISIDSRLAKYHRSYATALNRSKDHMTAAAQLKYATKLFPDDNALLSQYAWTSISAGEMEEAEAAFNKLATKRPQPVDVARGLRAVRDAKQKRRLL